MLRSLQLDAPLADRRLTAPSPADDLVAPFLLGAFRLLDRIFSGGRVTESFQLDRTKTIAPKRPSRPPSTAR